MPSLTVDNRERSDDACFRKIKREVYQLMPLIHVVMVLIVVGVLLWIINQFIPMAGSIKSILNVVVVIVVVLWLLNAFGIYNYHSLIHMGK
jgi:sterol desaturase/sphingolipid hydroxylase (fatty acid hydroxylase superfamily)